MRFDLRRRGRSPSPLFCYLWLASASAVTLATSSGVSGGNVSGYYRVVSDCPGAKGEGTLNANFSGPTSRLIPIVTVAPASPTPSATPETAAAPESSPTPPLTTTPSPTPEPTASPSPSATPGATYLASGTAPGATVFGFPSTTFEDRGEFGSGEWTLESRGPTRVCRAAMAQNGEPDVIAFACRDARTEELHCVITLTRLSGDFRSNATASENAVPSAREGLEIEQTEAGHDAIEATSEGEPDAAASDSEVDDEH